MGWSSGYRVMVEDLRAHRMLRVLEGLWKSDKSRWHGVGCRWVSWGWRRRHCAPVSLIRALEKLYGACLLSASKQRWLPGKPGLCLIHHCLPVATSCLTESRHSDVCRINGWMSAWAEPIDHKGDQESPTSLDVKTGGSWPQGSLAFINDEV